MFLKTRLDEITHLRLVELAQKYNYSNLSKIISHSIYYFENGIEPLYKHYGQMKYNHGIYLSEKIYNQLIYISGLKNMSINKTISYCINKLYENDIERDKSEI